MKKLLLLLLLAVMIAPAAKADEGMWLPSVISKQRLKDMKKKGFKLSAEDIYSVNKASLKDAVVLLSGCTGEIISDKGLILTNHHCGLGQVQYHSSLENDYITNGFSAMSLEEELPTNNYWASILIRMEDVTAKVMKGVTEENRKETIAENIKDIIEGATFENGYEAKVEALYYENQYFLFVYEKYNDVRLVCAPPSAIGKFGGDTDNWMWPRHTGDFTMFRIYANKDNKPARYSKDNVPYTPKRSLKISVKGVSEGDFTFIYGFPGRTNEYLFSDAVSYIAEKSNPHKIALRDIRLDVMKAAAEKDKYTRIQYTAKIASVANAWKKWQGEAGGIIKLDAVGKKQRMESEFTAWSQGNPKYENIISNFSKLYAELEPYAFVIDYYSEAVMGCEAIAAVSNGNADIKTFKSKMELFYKNYNQEIDLEISKRLLKSYVKNIDKEFAPDYLPRECAAIDAFVEEMYKNSLFSNKELYDEAMKLSDKELFDLTTNDPVYKFRMDFYGVVKTKAAPKYNELNNEITLQYRDFMQGQMEMQPEREFYPDANSTLRIAYGKVTGFNPVDGVWYTPLTTLDGVMAKVNPNIYDYAVPEKMKEIYRTKDYGRWEVNGTVPVCILASNHTTGGNSGSPILNGKGELVGLNFDRCWESTMSDVIYDKDMCRNIAVDIRYVLFLVDKICGAGYLIDEMNLVE